MFGAEKDESKVDYNLRRKVWLVIISALFLLWSILTYFLVEFTQ